MAISNLRYPKVFVLNPSSELVTTNTLKATDLTLNQVGIFNAITNVGTGATPSAATQPTIVIHQNLGDSKHGTIRTRGIGGQRVRGWHASKNSVAVEQISYIGYDEVDANKQLIAYKGQSLEVVITLFSNELKKWFGACGYTHRIVVDIANGCIPCQADCELLVEDALADWLVAYINGTNAPANSFPVTLELKNFLTASKVSTGTKRGVKLVAKAQPIELLDAGNPQQFFRSELVTFGIGIPYNCPNFPITTTVKAKQGKGYPLQVSDLEKESQGYDRVRDVFEHTKHMKTNYILRAANGVKYDFYFLEFDSTHADSGIPKEIKDPYTVIFCVPAGTGAALEACINAWVAPLGFSAVDISSGTATGTANVIENA